MIGYWWEIENFLGISCFVYIWGVVFCFSRISLNSAFICLRSSICNVRDLFSWINFEFSAYLWFNSFSLLSWSRSWLFNTETYSLEGYYIFDWSIGSVCISSFFDYCFVRAFVYYTSVFLSSSSPFAVWAFYSYSLVFSSYPWVCFSYS